MSKVLDANIILRYLVGDSPMQLERVRKFLKKNKGGLILTDVTVAEVVWVLDSYYELDKKDIVEKILSLLDLPAVVVNKSLITLALMNFRMYQVSYIDAYLVAYTDLNNCEGLLSFDKLIDKIKDVKRFEP